MRRSYKQNVQDDQNTGEGTYENPIVNTQNTYDPDNLSDGYTKFSNVIGEPIVNVIDGDIKYFEFTAASSSDPVVLSEFFNTHVDLFDGTSDFKQHLVCTLNPQTQDYIDGSGSDNTNPWVSVISCNQYTNATNMEEGFALRTYKKYSRYDYAVYMWYTTTTTTTNQRVTYRLSNMNYLYTIDVTKTGTSMKAVVTVGSTTRTITWTCGNRDADLSVILGGEIKYLNGVREIKYNANMKIREFSCEKF